MRWGPDLQSWFAAYMTQAHLTFWRKEEGQGTRIASKHFISRSSVAGRYEKDRMRHGRRNHSWEAGLICSGIRASLHGRAGQMLGLS